VQRTWKSGNPREKRFHAILDGVDKIFGKNRQCYFPRAANEQSPFTDGLTSGDVPVANQAKREVTVEALPVSLGANSPPGGAWTCPVMRGRIVSSRCTTLHAPEVKRGVIAASDTPLVTTAPKAASTGHTRPCFGQEDEPARRAIELSNFLLFLTQSGQGAQFEPSTAIRITAWLSVRVPPALRCPAQFRFPGAVGIVFDIPRLWLG
jgi:hypothetical protein